MLINIETVKTKYILRQNTSNNSIYSTLEILRDPVMKGGH